MNSRAQAGGIALPDRYRICELFQGTESDESACRPRTRCIASHGGSKRVKRLWRKKVSRAASTAARSVSNQSGSFMPLAKRAWIENQGRAKSFRRFHLRLQMVRRRFSHRPSSAEFPRGLRLLRVASGTRARVSRPLRRASSPRRAKGPRFRAA